MTSEVQICNLALLSIGQQSIVSLDDGTSSADNCKTLLYDLADEVIALGPWTSCVFRQDLALISGEPTSVEWLYNYMLPTDPYCLKVLNITNAGYEVPFAIEGRVLRTNASSITIKYIGRPASTEDYDIYLRRTVVARLALGLAYTNTGTATTVQFAQQMYDRILKESRTFNNQQGTAQSMRKDTLMDPRFNGGVGCGWNIIYPT